MHDPQHNLDGMLILRCLFCELFQTPMEYDMKVHLRYIHPLKRRAFDMDHRTDFAIDIIKQRTPQVLYDHRTTKFVLSEN